MSLTPKSKVRSVTSQMVGRSADAVSRSNAAKRMWIESKQAELAKSKPGSKSKTGDGFQVYRAAVGPKHLTLEQIAKAVTSLKR